MVISRELKVTSRTFGLGRACIEPGHFTMLRMFVSRYLQGLLMSGAGTTNCGFSRSDARWTGVAVRFVTASPAIGQPFEEPMSWIME